MKKNLKDLILYIIIGIDYILPLVIIYILYPDGTYQHFNFIDSLLVIIVPEGLWVGIQLILLNSLLLIYKKKGEMKNE